MPVNRSQAERSASYLKRKFSRDTKLREDCIEKEVIRQDYTEKVPQVSTTIRNRIKYAWFSTVPPSFMGHL